MTEHAERQRNDWLKRDGTLHLTPAPNAMPRVLQVFSTLGRGGAESALMTLYRNWDRDSLQFDFVVHGGITGEFEEEALNLGARIYRIPRVSLWTIASYRRKWKEFLREHPEYIAVHGHYHTISSLYLGVASLGRLPVVAHSHSDMPGWRGVLVRLLNRSLRDIASLKLACSVAAGRSFYGSKCVDSGEVVVFKNPIDVASFGYRPDIRLLVREQLGISSELVLGHVGRFNSVKNHRRLIRMFALVSASRPASRLVLVGDGPLRRACERQVAALGLSERVLFLGVREDVPDLLQAMDVFVLPSRWEGFGIVALEAQASGLRTVVSDAVPEEVRVTDLCEVLPLSATNEIWASCILAEGPVGERGSRVHEVIESGFDARDGVSVLRGMYRKLEPAGRPQ